MHDPIWFNPSLCLIGGKWVPAITGETLNITVLLGVVISLGMLVDDAVVVVEGIDYHMQRGMDGISAVKTTIQEVAKTLGIGHSTLNKWITQSRNQEFEPVSINEVNRMKHDKRPQDWSMEERLNAVAVCHSLDPSKKNEYCREQGIYPHHIDQWKLDFIQGQAKAERPVTRAEIKAMKNKNKQLQKELNRKDKALAETAALLVLQKKVNEIWGYDEDDSL